MSTPDEVRIRIESDPGWRKINAAPKGTTISGNTRMRAHPNLERRRQALQDELDEMKTRRDELSELIEWTELANSGKHIPPESEARVLELLAKYGGDEFRIEIDG